MAAPPSFMMGPKRWIRDTLENDEAESAARYPFLDVSRRGFCTSGPFAREWTRMSILPKSFSTSAAHSATVQF